MIDLIAAGEAAERKNTPDQCVAIEDSNIGVRSALGAGLAKIITVSDYTAQDDFSDPAAVFCELGDYDRKARSISGPDPQNGIVDLDFLREIQSLTRASRHGFGVGR